MGLLSTLRHIKASENEARVLIVGLDCSGKTTIVNSLLGKDMMQVAPTLGFNIDEYRPAASALSISLWDVGGQSTIRTYWRNYFSQTDALIWVIDSTDRRRLDVCRRALSEVLHAERLQGCLVVILCNKQDVSTALSADEIAGLLALDRLCRNRPYRVFPCSARERTGVAEAFDWLVRELEDSLYAFAREGSDDLETQVW